MNFWGFWSQEPQEPETAEATEESETATVASDLVTYEKTQSWVSVFEAFRDRPNDEVPSKAPTLAPQHAALRSFTRRAHQLLAKQHQRAWQSRRAAVQDHVFARERGSLAVAEAEELEDLLWQMKGSSCGTSEPPASSREESDLDRAERLSGWSTSASSGGSKASDQLLSRWECEDVELRQELLALQGAKSQAASELRSALLRLRGEAPSPRGSALLQLTQSCADSMHGEVDDWALAEAQLLEVLSIGEDDPDFTLRHKDEGPLPDMPGLHCRSAEEQRDQTALQNLLQRIEKLSQRMEQEASVDRKAQRAMENAKRAAKEQRRRTFRQARMQLESQVQKLVEENQALEAKLEAEKAQRARAGAGAGIAPRRAALEKKLSPAERLALSNRRARSAKGPTPGDNGTSGYLNSSQIFGSQRRILQELRKELAETYEVLALRSLPPSERELVLARRASELHRSASITSMASMASGQQVVV